MIDVIVVSYNSAAVLTECIRSLLSSKLVHHIWIVNNSPLDRLPQFEARVSVLNPGSNLGFGPGVNYAASKVATNIVAIVNPDTVTSPGTLEACHRYLSSHEEVGILSPRVYVDGVLFPTSEHEFSFFRLLFEHLMPDRGMGIARTRRDHLRTHSTQALNGAFLVARAEVLNSIEWFDPSIFLFGEDADICRRIRATGSKVVYLAEGRVDHVDGHAWKRNRPEESRRQRRSARIEQLSRARGKGSVTAYKFVLYLRDLVADSWNLVLGRRASRRV